MGQVQDMTLRVSHKSSVSADLDPAFGNTIIRRIYWCAQAAAQKASITAEVARKIEHRVIVDFMSSGLVAIPSALIEAEGLIVVCDMDATGTATIMNLLDPDDYIALVDQALDDDVLGIPHAAYGEEFCTRH
ncbi:MAG: hypothetical protein P4M00_15355 [Azospirillaceae bacterium]|nr:hypothetical protein [Azospirillaceae bacterium]